MSRRGRSQLEKAWPGGLPTSTDWKNLRAWGECGATFLHLASSLQNQSDGCKVLVPERLAIKMRFIPQPTATPYKFLHHIFLTQQFSIQIALLIKRELMALTSVARFAMVVATAHHENGNSHSLSCKGHGVGHHNQTLDWWASGGRNGFEGGGGCVKSDPGGLGGGWARSNSLGPELLFGGAGEGGAPNPSVRFPPHPPLSHKSRVC